MEMLFVMLVKNTPGDMNLGWIVTIAGFVIVLIALFILSLIFLGIASRFTKKSQKSEIKAPELAKATAKAPEGDIPSDVLAAIGMALCLSTDPHDVESNVITIKRRDTSCNAKIYGVSNWNR